MKNYKEFWAYKQVKELGYKVKVTKTKVSIFFDDGDEYAVFTLKNFDGEYMVYLDNCNITYELEYCGTYDEAVSSCFYYFVTRF